MVTEEKKEYKKAVKSLQKMLKRASRSIDRIPNAIVLCTEAGFGLSKQGANHAAMHPF